MGLDPGQADHQQFILQPHFMKRKEYESEREVRFVAYGPENLNRGGITLKQIDPNDWIQRIKFWPELTCSEESSLKTAVKNFAPSIQCFKSDLLTSVVDSGDDEVGVEAAFAVTDETSWEGNSDGIPSFLKRHER